MKPNIAFFVSKEAVKSDPALADGGRGARKLIVTELYETKERIADIIKWIPPKPGEKCAVQVMPNVEIAVFNHQASQDRHYHENGTEVYMVLEGLMTIEIANENYIMQAGDMMIVNPKTIHEVKTKPGGNGFLCRVVTLNCGGVLDKFIQHKAEIV
jgi:mannose-6-phosphate isomerase-like protein (cupin superfamily)